MPALIKLLEDTANVEGRMQATQALGRLPETDQLREPVAGKISSYLSLNAIVQQLLDADSSLVHCRCSHASPGQASCGHHPF